MATGKDSAVSATRHSNFRRMATGYVSMMQLPRGAKLTSYAIKTTGPYITTGVTFGNGFI